MDRLLCLVATRPVVPEPCNGSNRRSILLAFHTDKKKDIRNLDVLCDLFYFDLLTT